MSELARLKTLTYNVIMSILSIRFKRKSVHERLRRRADERGESVSGLGERFIDEGLRMEAHPGIAFRDGPSGRRAGLAAGPDVWEIAGMLRGLEGSPEERIAECSARLRIAVTSVRVASAYYAEFRDEIDAEIAANQEAADRELVAWETERRLLSS